MTTERNQDVKHVTMAEQFVKSVKNLPPATRVKAWQVIDRLLTDPGDPALQLEPHRGATREGVYDCRIDAEHGLILLQQPDRSYALVWAGPCPESHASDRLLERGEIAAFIVGEERAFLYSGTDMPFTEMPVQELADILESEED